VIVVDTTILVYAVGTQHPLRDPCRAVVEAVDAGHLAASTTIEVIQEFCHVRARRRKRADAVALARSYADLFSPLLVVDADDLAEGLDLFDEIDPLGTFDAVLAATARRRAADALVSADIAFSTIADLPHLDPASPGFTTALARRR
jgi:predicted nucleic acid-binding protein